MKMSLKLSWRVIINNLEKAISFTTGLTYDEKSPLGLRHGTLKVIKEKRFIPTLCRGSAVIHQRVANDVSPLLPSKKMVRLNDPILRENFLLRVFTQSGFSS